MTAVIGIKQKRNMRTAGGGNICEHGGGSSKLKFSQPDASVKIVVIPHGFS